MRANSPGAAASASLCPSSTICVHLESPTSRNPLEPRDSFAAPCTFVNNGDAVIKTGGQHLESIHDDRTVFLDGGAVADVTTDPAYRNAVVTVGRLYDIQASPELMAQYGPT